MPTLLTTDTPFPSAEVIGRLALSASGFVFDPVTGASYTVNATGLAILRTLQAGGRQIGEIVQTLAREFSAPSHIVERDVIEFSGRLRDMFRGALK